MFRVTLFAAALASTAALADRPRISAADCEAIGDALTALAEAHQVAQGAALEIATRRFQVELDAAQGSGAERIVARVRAETLDETAALLDDAALDVQDVVPGITAWRKLCR